jgi:hypothetical protein
MEVAFTREVGGELQSSSATLYSPPETLSDPADFSIDDLLNRFDDQVEGFNARGSDWLVCGITAFALSVAPFRPCAGSSWLPTPADLADKKCVVNVRNDDNKCFLYSVAAGELYDEVKDHRYRVANYKECVQGYNIEGLTFPLPINQVHIFEKITPNSL